MFYNTAQSISKKKKNYVLKLSEAWPLDEKYILLIILWAFISTKLNILSILFFYHYHVSSHPPTAVYRPFLY